MNMKILSILIVSVLLVAGCASAPPADNGGNPSPSPDGGDGPTKEFNILAKKFSFEPSTITVNKGDKVVLNLLATDVEHGFSIATFNIVETLPVGQQKTVTFVADEVGEFNFFCSVWCGEGHGSMRGKLIVNP